jgi:2-dehydro-3-deoxygalactonokinase
MTRAAFIAGDWGTSRLRLSLCESTGAVLAAVDGPGIARLTETPAATFAMLVASWDAAHGALPALLCGMVGSSLGWQTVPYLPCPARCDALTAAALRIVDAGRPVLLLPGLSCRNRQDSPDRMRGEETQIAGALHLEPRLAEGRHLLCLPGTHSKWVLLAEGTVQQFQTALTGELYDLLCRHSVLLGGAAPAPDAAGFGMGVAAAQADHQGGLLPQLFSTRSLQLAGELGKDQAAAYLSGLMIGHEILGMRRLFAAEWESGITLIGDPALTGLYAQALKAFGKTAHILDGETASRAGLTQAHEASVAHAS